MADPEGFRGLTPPPPRAGFCFACQYMKIPADMDPKPPPPLEEFRPRTPPPPEEFLGPPLGSIRLNEYNGKQCRISRP